MNMRGLVAFAAVAVCCASGTAFGFSGEYVANTRSCAGSVEKWVDRHAGGGQKIVEQRGTMGAFAAYLMRWNDGTLQEVTIGPANDTEGRPAICVLAQRHVGGAGQS
jgi:hypothetical protein